MKWLTALRVSLFSSLVSFQCPPFFLLLWDAAAKALCLPVCVSVCEDVLPRVHEGMCVYVDVCMTLEEEMVLMWCQLFPDGIFQMMWSPSYIDCVCMRTCVLLGGAEQHRKSGGWDGGRHGNMASCGNENRKLEPNEDWYETSAIQKETMIQWWRYYGDDRVFVSDDDRWWWW